MMISVLISFQTFEINSIQFCLVKFYKDASHANKSPKKIISGDSKTRFMPNLLHLASWDNFFPIVIPNKE